MDEQTSTKVNEVKYPHITVQLAGENGNAYVILFKIKKALHNDGVPAATIQEFFDEATSDDYDHLLQTCMRWVNVQ